MKKYELVVQDTTNKLKLSERYYIRPSKHFNGLYTAIICDVYDKYGEYDDGQYLLTKWQIENMFREVI